MSDDLEWFAKGMIWSDTWRDAKAESARQDPEIKPEGTKVKVPVSVAAALGTCGLRGLTAEFNKDYPTLVNVRANSSRRTRAAAGPATRREN